MTVGFYTILHNYVISGACPYGYMRACFLVVNVCNLGSWDLDLARQSTGLAFIVIPGLMSLEGEEAMDLKKRGSFGYLLRLSSRCASAKSGLLYVFSLEATIYLCVGESLEHESRAEMVVEHCRP